MRRFAIIFTGLFLCLAPSLHCAGQIDSTRLAALDARLEEYFRTLEPERIEVKNDECDLLISSAKDSALQRHIALKIYDHYLESPVMGDEAVAIHLTDKWFAPGLIDLGSDEALLNAKVYADFNRQSLLGMKAPAVEMETPEGVKVEVGGQSARYRVLFFYDTDCSKCKVETILLRSKLNTRDWPIDVYAIYTGVSAESWKEWRDSKFTVRAPETKVIHLWDPEVRSDYQMKYGVIQTPRMFLLDRSGTIIGRGMDTKALELLLDIVLSDASYEYGGSASSVLMDKLFSVDQDVASMARALEDRTLAKGDTAFFKHLEGDLLYWLSSRRDETSKEGTIPFIDEYILLRPEIWNTPDDTLKVVGLARMMKDLLSRTPVGSKLPKAKALVSLIPQAESRPHARVRPGRITQPPGEASSSLRNSCPAVKGGIKGLEPPEGGSSSLRNSCPAVKGGIEGLEPPEEGSSSLRNSCPAVKGGIKGLEPPEEGSPSLRNWIRKWNRLRGKGGYIVFHSEGCPVCKAELSAADSLGLRTLDVNVDEIMVSHPDLGKALLDTFDLSSMPMILEVGRHGVIRRRYVSFRP